MKAKKAIPYYHKSRNLSEQIKRSSSNREMGKVKFLLKKIRNHICESLAYNCPVNTWRVILHKWRGVHIGKNVFIGLHCTLDHAYPEYIYLEDEVGLAGDVYILAHSNPPVHLENLLESYVAPVVIKKGAWIAIKATILPDVTVGENAVVGAGVVVSTNVPGHSIITLSKNKAIPYDKSE